MQADQPIVGLGGRNEVRKHISGVATQASGQDGTFNRRLQAN